MFDCGFGFLSSTRAPGGLPVNAGLFSQTANSATITNTTTESTLIDGGVGVLTVPENGFAVGDSFMAHMNGHLSSVNNTNITFRVKSGSVILATSGLVQLPQTTNQAFSLNLIFTIRAIGAASVASIQTNGLLTYTKDASNAFEGKDLSDLNNTTFSTTISNTLNITAQWATANPLNIIYSETFVLNKIY